MEEIRINKNEDGTFVVEQRNLKSLNCGWDEMMGLLSAMTMPHERPCLQWLKKKEKPYEPKDGDFLISDRDDYMFIYNANGNFLTSFYVGLDIKHNSITRSGKTIFTASGNHIEDYRPATEEEKQRFIERLHVDKLDWDDENKKVVDWKWYPKINEKYYYPTAMGCLSIFSVQFSQNQGGSIDLALIDMGRTFRTKEECQSFCDKLNEAISNVK